jgi:4-hydroxyphenylpyruvate dioxygenase-like putative hemolysin
MTEKTLAKTLQLGAVRQIGMVVRDLEKSMVNYQRSFGVGPFAVFHFRPEKSYVRGRDGKIALKIGIAPLTPELSLELIEVEEGQPFHLDFLKANGEGVQHLGFVCNDYERVLSQAESMNIPVLMSAETFVEGMGHVRGVYLDTLDLAGVLFEVIEIRPVAGA